MLISYRKGFAGLFTLLPCIFAVAVAMIVTVAPAWAQSPGDALHVRHSRATGLASFVTGVNGDPIPVKPPRGQARVQPVDFLRDHGGLFGVTDPLAQLEVCESRVDSIGHTHTTYRQVHKGIPVFSGVLRVHQDREGQIVAANGDFYPISPKLTLTPTITAGKAAAIASAELSHMRQTVGQPTVEHSELVIVDPGWYGDPPTGARLAYHIILSDTALREAFFVDAHTGETIDQWTLICTARNRMIYTGFGSPSLPGTLARTEGGPSTGRFDVDAAYDYLGDTYDYYLRAFGRDSIDGIGMYIVATVESTAPVCPNAYWNGVQMVFCPGTVTDDIAAHELTHGVTQFTANLIYQNQSGQLNESFSDVFSELVDLFNGDAAFAGPPGGAPWPTHPTGPGTDTPNDPRGTSCGDGVRWLVTEDAAAFGGAIRDMWNPPCFGDPDRANSPLFVCPWYDNGGVHIGSGVPNHAFAIVTDGKTFNGYTVAPIGPIKAGAIWYRALTTYLTPASDFTDAFFAFVQAGSDLIGLIPDDPRTGGPSDSPITADDVLEVARALRAVEMDTAGQCGFGDRVLTSNAAFRCPSWTTIFVDDFESGADGWMMFNSGPPTPYDWALTTGVLPFGRPGVAWFCEDRNIGDCDEQDESAVHSLLSPVIVLPGDADSTMLSFTHYIRTEGSWDGGNVKIRVNGGPWQIVPRSAFEHNPYNARLNTASPQGSTNPLAGEAGWTGLGGQWGTSIADLSDLAGGGDTIELLFEFGKDGCTGVTGWYLDDVEVYACPDCDADGVPDYREYRFTYSFPPVGNIGDTSPQTLIILSPPPAGSDVTLSFTAIGDFSSDREFIAVRLNYLLVGEVFEWNTADCPLVPETDEIIVGADSFNGVVRDGPAVFELKPSSSVNATMCNGASFVTLSVKYHLTAPPTRELYHVERNRYLSFVPWNRGRETALRVTLADLPPPLDVHNGETRWVGQPFDVSELPGTSGTTPPTFKGARLACEPVLLDWGTVDILRVFGEEIVPGAVYEVRAFEEACGTVVEETGAPAATFTTGKWGDVAEPFATSGGSTQPDILDVVAILDKFRSLPGAPIKASADLYPSRPDNVIDIIDATMAADAFRGMPYPFDGPRPCP